MAQEVSTDRDLLREARQAELALIEAEIRAEEEMVIAEERYRQALEKLARAQERAAIRRREFDLACARLDQCQLERAAGPMLRRISVPRPSLPRPARDDSRARARQAESNGPTPEGDGPSEPESA